MPATPSSPEPFIGAYTILEARAPDGSAYGGTVRFDRHGSFLLAESTLVPGGARHGLAMAFAGRLVMAFGPKDKVEIGAYQIDGTRMSALWVPPGADLSGCGHEESVVGDRTGVWEIERAVAIDGQPYTGRITVSPADTAAPGRPTPLRMIWDLHDGQYQSFALGYDDAIYSTFSFEPEATHGIIVYEIADDGRTLRGRSISSKDLVVGDETLRRRD